MNLDIVVVIAQLLTSLVAVFGIFLSARTASQQRKYNEKDNNINEEDIATEVHRQFAEMWFMMDETFIAYPAFHKYFYPCDAKCAMKTRTSEIHDYRNQLPEGEDLERAICIAEKFRDVFQYSEHMALKIVNEYSEDCASFYMYIQRIQSTAVYKEMDKRNPINIEKAETGKEPREDRKPIGSKLKGELQRMGYIFTENDYIGPSS